MATNQILHKISYFFFPLHVFYYRSLSFQYTVKPLHNKLQYNEPFDLYIMSIETPYIFTAI